MAFFYNSFLNDLVRGRINIDTDVFKMMLVTNAYIANRDIDDRRNDVTAEASGTGYTSGGIIVTVTATLDTSNDQLVMTVGAASWPSATITAAGWVVYKSRGGAASADELLIFNEFGADITRTNQTFAVASSTIYIRVNG